MHVFGGPGRLLSWLLLLLVSTAPAWPAKPAAAQGPPRPAAAIMLAVEDNWYPYAGLQDGKAVGFSVDLVRAAYAAAGVRVNFKPMPFPRCLAEVERGQELGCFNAAAEGASMKTGKLITHATPLFAVYTGCYVRVDSPLDKLKARTLRGVVGFVRGGYYGRAIEENKGVVRDESPSELANLRKLLRGRVEMALVDRRTFAYLVRTHFAEFGGKFRDAMDPKDMTSPGLSRILFSARFPDAARYAALLDEGLAAIKDSGEYERINDRWSSLEPEPSP